MSNSSFEGDLILDTYILRPYEAINIRDFNLDNPSENIDLFDSYDEVNIDVNIDNSSFINAYISLKSVGGLADDDVDNTVWDDPNYRRRVDINRSEISGSVDLIETSLVEDSVINGGCL